MQAKIFATLVLSAWCAAPAFAITWHFEPGGSELKARGNGFGNELFFAEAGAVIGVTAWAESGSKEQFAKAFAGQYDTGIGACNSAEDRKCYRDALPQAIDNSGEREWLLLQFDDEFQLENFVVSPALSGKLGISYWTGSISASAKLNRISYDDLAGLGFGPRQDVFFSGPDPVSVALGSRGNAVLIGSYRYGSSDGFYLQSMQASPPVVPVPAAAWLFGSALVLLGMLRRHLHSDNPGLALWR